MKKIIHEKCITALKEKLIEALKSSRISSEEYLDIESYALISKLDNTLPTDATTKKLLATWISDTPFSDFVTSKIGELLSANSATNPHTHYDSQLLSDHPNFENINSVSEYIVNEFSDLPKKYILSFPLGISAGYLKDKKRIEISKDIYISTRHEDRQRNSYIGNHDRNKKTSIQIHVEGYSCFRITTNTDIVAQEKLKSILGLHIAHNSVYFLSLLREDTGHYYRNQLDNKKESFSTLPRGLAAALNSACFKQENICPDTFDPVSNKAEADHLENHLKLAFKENEHAKKIRLACAWLFNSGISTDGLLRFIQSTTVLEILYGDKEETDKVGISALIRNRLAYSISKSLPEREEIARLFKQIYSTRSKILHNGYSILDSEEQNIHSKLRDFTKRAIIAELNLLSPED
ncbi:HEPN domain-containing protein [Simiduia curdlanivorans]|uniref:HEPN domain-containing protein n=1 Tax=Simiduia curdlanivorans TaxID=1492769 RepID=A0ABV8V1G2_9GAMM|nr:HEPN domain-containing protein [Simiduia curdlanivorans]MDN3639238.1 HEPN domain-containing protein [Simiduia curdlanivorans]